MKFGLFLPQNDFVAAKEAAKRAEADGFWSVSMNDPHRSQRVAATYAWPPPLPQPGTVRLRCSLR